MNLTRHRASQLSGPNRDSYIETALSGLGQKGTLEALVIRGASTQSLALVEEKAIIPKVELIPLMDVEEKELKPQIPLDPDLSLKALEYILEELKAGKGIETSL